MNTVKKIMISAAGLMLCASVGFAQSSVPAPGAGGGFRPGGGGGFGGNSAPAPGAGGGFQPSGPAFGGPGWNGPAWGGPWGGGWQASPPVVVNVNPGVFTGMNNGVCNVVGVGYDAQGIWRTVPMRVAYSWNGAQYNVMVLNAWNPWTDMWNRGIDTQAYNTTYYLHGNTYNFYTILPTGTFYFNL